MEEFISCNDPRSCKLIPIHINKARLGDYFYDWSSDLKGWVLGDKISEYLKRMYKNPMDKSSY